jgi:hypothetical protein
VCKRLLRVLNDSVASEQQAGNIETSISGNTWIMEPYEVIVHNKKQIEQHSSKLEDGVVKKHFELVLKFLDVQQPGAWQKHDEVYSGQCQQVLFEHLWILYPPGITVFRKDDGAWRAYKIERSETIVDMKPAILRIYAWFLDFNKTGDVLVPYRETFEISSFCSERLVKDLELIPDWFIRPTDSLCQNLIDRGRQHWGYRNTSCHREYKGDAWHQAPYNVR